MSKLEQQRAKIEETLAHLRRRSEKVRRDLHRPLEADSKEQAAGAENDEVLTELQIEGERQIILLEEALRRMDGGQYGQCEDCDQAIGEARLAALPYAVVCLSCAEQRERNAE